MKTCKELTLLGVYCALLIGGQLALNGIAGIEIVTVLSVCFCFYFGLARGVIVMTLFSLLRCLVFGFYPTVIILYLIYYNLLAVCYGVIGKVFKKDLTIWWKFLIFVLTACVLTVCFTMLDNIITPLYLKMSKKATYAYFYSSLPIMTTQTVSALFTVSFLSKPIFKAYGYIKLD